MDIKDSYQLIHLNKFDNYAIEWVLILINWTRVVVFKPTTKNSKVKNNLFIPYAWLNI